MSEQQEVLKAEIVKAEEVDRLQSIVKNSRLSTTKAQFILDKFQGYFKMAAEWELRARAIVVTDESQVELMKQARTERLFLKEKRVAIENHRKELKEESLREGKAIDGISNILKALIEPIEEHLEKQERFIQIKAAEKAERDRQMEEQRLEAERLAQEEAERKEQERIKAENARLKAEAEKHAAELAAQKAKADAEKAELEAKAAAERAAAEAERKAIEDKARAEREAAETAARAEREKQDAALAAQRAEAEAAAKIERERQAKILADQQVAAKAEQDRLAEIARQEREVLLAQQKAAAEKAAKEKAEAEAERIRLEEELKATVECPHCHKTFKLERK